MKKKGGRPIELKNPKRLNILIEGKYIDILRKSAIIMSAKKKRLYGMSDMVRLAIKIAVEHEQWIR